MAIKFENCRFNSNPARRLGKHPKRHDPRTLLLSRYLPKLPAPPAAIDHASVLPMYLGEMGNDTYGDCTVAAAGHAVQEWSVYAQRGIETIPDAQILAAYKVISPNDDGANMIDVLNYWRNTGIGGEEISAYAEVAAASLDYAKLCIQYFGVCYIGISLPDTNTFGPWTDPTASGPPDQNNGHCVILIAYNDATQMFKVVTWGQIIDMSYSWYQAYNDESYAVLNNLELIQASGLSPEGFNWAQLQDDLSHVNDPVTNPPNPTPGPTPNPTPSPSWCCKAAGLTWKAAIRRLRNKPGAKVSPYYQLTAYKNGKAVDADEWRIKLVKS